MLTNALGTQTIDVTVWGATGGATTLTTTEHFDTAHKLKDEVVNARVWAGLHWRSSVVAGEELGDSVAGWSLSHYFGSLGARSRQRRLMSAGCAAVTAAQLVRLFG